jgi:ribosome biogenesis protein MAK21
VDADREDVVEVKEKVEIKVSEYDPIKIEPKFANAEESPLWELATLARHCHPTICKWAEFLLQGSPIEYVGDPLLDFSIANFLDRISYKNPKASDKIDQFRKRMASYEKPVNQIDFHGGERPEVDRQEEEFMYKYMKMKGPLRSKPT